MLILKQHRRHYIVIDDLYRLKMADWSIVVTAGKHNDHVESIKHEYFLTAIAAGEIVIEN